MMGTAGTLIMKISLSVRWFLFKLKIKNILKKFRFRKMYKSRMLKQELKNLVSNNRPYQITFALNEMGFYKLTENQKSPSIYDLCEKAIELVSIHFGPRKHFELTIYDQVPGYEDTLVIEYTWALIEKNDLIWLEHLGLFIDKTFSYQTREEKIKNMILKFAKELA